MGTDDNIQGISLFNDDSCYWDLINYSKQVSPKLVKILNENIAIEQCQKCVIHVMKISFDENTDLCPSIKYMGLQQTDPSIRQEILCALEHWVCHENHIGIIHDMLRCKYLLKSILSYRPITDKSEEYEKLFDVIGEFLQTNYENVGEIMLENGILDTFIDALTHCDEAEWAVLDCFELLNKFNLGSKYLEDIYQSDWLMGLLHESFKRSHPLTHALLSKIKAEHTIQYLD